MKFPMRPNVSEGLYNNVELNEDYEDKKDIYRLTFNVKTVVFTESHTQDRVPQRSNSWDEDEWNFPVINGIRRKCGLFDFMDIAERVLTVND